MEINLKKAQLESFKTLAVQRSALHQKRNIAATEFTDSFTKLCEVSRELLEDVTVEDLRRLIFASLPEKYRQADLYGSGELMSALCEKVAIADWWSNEPYPLAYHIIRLGGSPWREGLFWRAHLHVSLDKIGDLNIASRSRWVKASVCHHCIRDFACSSGKICVMIEGPTTPVAQIVRYAVENDYAPITALESVEKIETDAEAPKITFKKYRVVHEYKSEKVYEVLATSEENASRLVNECRQTQDPTPTSESGPEFHDERVYCVDEDSAF